MMSRWYSLMSDSKQEVTWIVAVLIIHLSIFPDAVQGGSQSKFYQAQFCSPNHEIVISDRKTVTRGLIYSPIYNNHSDNRICEIKIILVNGSSVIVMNFKPQDKTPGPCIEGLFVNDERISGPCEEKKIDLSTDTTFSFQIGKEDKPAFHIEFQVFPSFDLLNQISSIDARKYPQGYITAQLSSSTQYTAMSDSSNGLNVEENFASLQLHNLPITSTINLHIEFVDMDSSGRDHFMIYIMEQTGTEEGSDTTRTMILFTPESLRGEHRVISNNSTLTFRYQIRQQQRSEYSLRLSYTIDYCEEDIPMLESLRQTQDNSSYYEVTCEDDFKSTNTEGTTFSCHNNQWSSEIDCTGSQSGLPTPKQTTDSPRQKKHSLLESVSIVLSVLLFIVVGVVFISKLYNRFSSEKIQFSLRARQLPELPRIVVLDIESDRCSELDNDVGYETIGTPDPYLDYSTINQNETLSNYQCNIIQENSNPPTNDCNLHDLQKSNCEPPSQGLYDIIIEEMRKKGIELHNTQQDETSGNQRRTTIDHVYEDWRNTTRDSQPISSQTINKCNPGVTISNSHHNLESTCRQQGQEVNLEMGCYDEDAESVCEMYTIKDDVKTVFKS